MPLRVAGGNQAVVERTRGAIVVRFHGSGRAPTCGRVGLYAPSPRCAAGFTLRSLTRSGQHVCWLHPASRNLPVSWWLDSGSNWPKSHAKHLTGQAYRGFGSALYRPRGQAYPRFRNHRRGIDAACEPWLGCDDELVGVLVEPGTPPRE